MMVIMIMIMMINIIIIIIIIILSIMGDDGFIFVPVHTIWNCRRGCGACICAYHYFNCVELYVPSSAFLNVGWALLDAGVGCYTCGSVSSMLMCQLVFLVLLVRLRACLDFQLQHRL